MVYMLFCTLAIVLSVFLEADEMGSKGLLYLLTSLAASFSNEHFIVFAPAILLSSLMAQWSLLGREPARFPRFPAIRYPGFSDRLRSSHTLRGPIFAALVSQRDFNACIPRLSAKLVVSDRCPRADTGSALPASISTPFTRLGQTIAIPERPQLDAYDDVDGPVRFSALE